VNGRPNGFPVFFIDFDLCRFSNRNNGLSGRVDAMANSTVKDRVEHFPRSIDGRNGPQKLRKVWCQRVNTILPSFSPSSGISNLTNFPDISTRIPSAHGSHVSDNASLNLRDDSHQPNAPQPRASADAPTRPRQRGSQFCPLSFQPALRHGILSRLRQRPERLAITSPPKHHPGNVPPSTTPSDIKKPKHRLHVRTSLQKRR